MVDSGNFFNVSDTILVVASAGLLTALAIWSLLYGALMLLGDRNVKVSERMRRFVVTRGRQSVDDTQERSQLRSELFSQIDSRFAGRTFFKRLKADLQKADLHLSVTEAVLVGIAASVALGVVLALLLRPVALLMLVAGFVLGLLFSNSFLKFLGRRRTSKFEDQLPDTLSILATSVRGGFSLFQALQLISREAGEPIKTEFLRIVREVTLGAPLDQSLEGLRVRIPTEDVDMLVTAIILQHQTGGNLSNVLDIVAHTVRERHRVQREIKSLTAQQRVSATILAALPFMLGAVLFLINPSYVGHLFEPGWVLAMPIGAAVLSLMGYLLMRRIAAIDV